MRIALLNDSFPPVIDGVANVVTNYASILHKSGHDVTVATPEYPLAQDAYPYPVIRYASLNTTPLVGYRAGYPFSARAVQALDQFAPDILHTHCPVASTLLARTARESTHAPIVFTYHTKFDIDIRTAIKGELLQKHLITALVRNVEACDEVWTVSEGAGQNLRSLGFTGTYRVMENGVDFAKGRADDALIDEVSHAYRLPADKPVLLFAGRMRWYKGVRLILEGLGKAKARGARFTLLMVGEGTDRTAMEQLAQDAGIGDDCIFTGAVRDRARLRAIYSRADLFLFPSTFDTNGLVVREAAACSLPSLLVRGSCAAEGAADHQNALLMEENADSLCASVLWALDHMDEVRAIGMRAADELYISWDTAVARAQARYAEILQENRSRPAHHAPADPIPFVSDCIEAINRMHDLRDKIKKHLE